MGLQQLFGRGRKKSQVHATSKSIVEDSVEVAEKSVSELLTRLAENPERRKMLAEEISSGHRSFRRVRLRSTDDRYSTDVVHHSCGLLWAELHEEKEETALDGEESLSIPISRSWGPASTTPAGRVLWQEGFVGSVRYKADATGVIRGRIAVSLRGHLLEPPEEDPFDMPEEWPEWPVIPETEEIEMEGITVFFVALASEEALNLTERVQQLAEELLPEHIADAVQDEGSFVWLNSEYLRSAFDFDIQNLPREAYVTWVRKVLTAPPGSIEQSASAAPNGQGASPSENLLPTPNEGPRISAAEAVVGTRVRHERLGDGTIVGIPEAGVVAISFDDGDSRRFLLSMAPLRLLG